mmetsp:Transcript_28414/g.53136  ORF Transcript_28414/g.53136 Transcript_28414/m.53136 type:complete len:222 (-) Transcript_28414:34-699(-)
MNIYITDFYLELRKDGIDIAELLVNHKSKNTHLGSTSLVQLNGALPHLSIIRKLVPSKVKGAVAEVSLELSWAVLKRVHVQAPWSGVLVLVGGLHHGPGGNHLSPNHTGESIQCGESGWDVLGARETNSGVGGEVSNNGKHGNTAVLELNPTKAVEVLLVSISDASEGVEEAKRGLGTKLAGEISVEGGVGGLGNRGGSECSGRAGKGSEDDKLHHFEVFN